MQLRQKQGFARNDSSLSTGISISMESIYSSKITVVPLLLVLYSVIFTDTSYAKRLSSLPKVSTPVHLSTAERKLSLPLETSYLSHNARKEPLSATSRRRLVTVVLSPEHLATMLPSLVTLPMRTRRGLGCPLD